MCMCSVSRLVDNTFSLGLDARLMVVVSDAYIGTHSMHGVNLKQHITKGILVQRSN